MKNDNLLKDNLRSYLKYKYWIGYTYPKLQKELDDTYTKLQGTNFEGAMSEGGNSDPNLRLNTYADKQEKLNQKRNIYIFMVEYCDSVMRMVKPEYRQVIELYAKTKMNIREIGAKTGYSHTRVHEIINEETSRLKHK